MNSNWHTGTSSGTFRSVRSTQAAVGAVAAKATRVLFEAILDSHEDFRYVEELHGSNSFALLFRARIGDRELQGLHHVHLNPQGLADELTLMVRPLSGAQAFAAAVGPKVLAGLAAL
jgi:hypothetical protein